MDSRRRSHGGRNPAEESEHLQRLRTRRLSIHQREEPKAPPPSPRRAPYTAAEIAVNRHANLGPGRRRPSAPRVEDSIPNNTAPTRTHRKSLPENVYLNHNTHAAVQARTNILPLPERSERRLSQPIDLARANIVPLREQLEPWVMSTRSITTYEPTYILRKNAEYFDVDQDGVIWPKDMYSGCRKLGWGILSSSFAMFALHLIFSYPTCSGYIPDSYSRIYYNNTHRGGFGSYRTTYDEKGRPRRNRACESILTKYDKSNQGGLTFRDLVHFWNEQRAEYNIYGWNIAVFEWLALYLFLWPRNGIMRSEDIRAAFNGTLLYKKAEERHLKFEIHRKRAGSGEGFRSSRRSNPVKLAVAVITGIVIMIWALRNISHSPPDWMAHWWKYSILQGASATDPELFDSCTRRHHKPVLVIGEAIELLRIEMLERHG
ncbi:Caleosin related protein-domain-containing protein [Annulohypoxylon moriforme]|nr:Caleosin related protein-domain-containing protein [Annulohypoxylon moriforme]